MRRRCARPVNDAGCVWVRVCVGVGAGACGRAWVWVRVCGVGFCCVDHFARVSAGFLGPCAHKMVHTAHARGAHGCM